MYYRNRNILLYALLVVMLIAIQSFMFYKIANILIMDKFDAIHIHKVDTNSSHLYLLDFTNARGNPNNVIRMDMFINDSDLQDLTATDSSFAENEALNSMNMSTIC